MSELVPPRALLYPSPEWLAAQEAWSRIPTAEQDTLLTTVAEALDLAGMGNPEAGHEILLWGLQRAEGHWSANPWGRELVLCYQEALDRYERSCLVRTPGTVEQREESWRD